MCWHTEEYDGRFRSNFFRCGISDLMRTTGAQELWRILVNYNGWIVEVQYQDSNPMFNQSIDVDLVSKSSSFMNHVPSQTIKEKELYHHLQTSSGLLTSRLCAYNCPAIVGPIALESEPNVWLIPFTVPSTLRDGVLWASNTAHTWNAIIPENTFKNKMAKIPNQIVAELSNFRFVVCDKSWWREGTH